jgi:micrococcal nuclease
MKYGFSFMTSMLLAFSFTLRGIWPLKPVAPALPGDLRHIKSRLSLIHGGSIMRLFLLSFLLFFALPLAAADQAVVKHVVDGDTIVVQSGAATLKVRLIGIDTPECKPNSKAFRDSERSGADVEAIVSQGKQASAFLKGILRKGDRVSLDYDVEKHDKYGRTLAYVYLSDGRLLNEVIIGSGYASPMTIPPNVKHQERFLKAYKDAREKGLGLWAK